MKRIILSHCSVRLDQPLHSGSKKIAWRVQTDRGTEKYRERGREGEEKPREIEREPLHFIPHPKRKKTIYR